MKPIQISKTKEFILTLLIAILYIGGVFVLLKIPGCGYHLVDDHEFTAWTYLLSQRQIPLMGLIKEYLISNMVIGRWRPLYLVMRGLFISVFGTDIRLYYIWAIIKTAVLFILIYYMARSMEVGIIHSYLAAFISLTGYQSAAWWKLGTHEIVTAIWFSAGMILMIRYLKNGKRSSAIFSLICYLIMSLYKETYIVLIPFICLYILYSDLQSEQISFRACIQSLKKRCAYYSVMVLIFIVNIIIIRSLPRGEYIDIGITDSGISPLIESFGTDMKWFVSFGLIMAVILISHDVETIKIWPDAVLFATFILPQFVLFASTGMTERYLLPFSIGFALFYCCQAPMHMKIGHKRKYIYYGVMFLMLIAHMRAMWIEGNYYRYRGESVTSMLNEIDIYTQAHPEHDPNILSCLYYEGNDLIYTHELLEGHDRTYEIGIDWVDYTYTISPVSYTHFITIESSQPELDSYTDLSGIDIIVAYNHEDRHWEYDVHEILGKDLSGYKKTTCGTLDVYTRQ